MTRTEIALPELYHEDETAWLEAMAELHSPERVENNKKSES